MHRLTSLLALVALLLVAAYPASAALYTANLSGAGEADPSSPGTGTATANLDTTAHTLTLNVTFSGLLGNTTASHIHAPTALPLTGNASVATQIPTFINFPLGVTSGTYFHTFDTSDLATWNPSFVTANGGTALGAEAALDTYLQAGKAYLNIHTSLHPGGEIRGFLVPEPASLTLLATGLAALVARPRRRAA